MEIVWKGSPNFDTNRKPINRIVIHWFGAGTIESAYSTFQKPSGTSAHYAISDQRIWQFVKEEHVAYHAGNYEMNQRSIGIEHDSNPDKPLSEASYQTSARLIAQICQKYNIPLDRTHIIKHSEVPRATACPGTIDLDKLISLAKNTEPLVYTQSQWQVERDERNKNWDLYQEQIKETIRQAGVFRKTIEEMSGRIVTLTSQVGTLTQTNKDQGVELAKLQASYATLNGEYQKCKTALESEKDKDSTPQQPVSPPIDKVEAPTKEGRSSPLLSSATLVQLLMEIVWRLSPIERKND